MREERHVLPGVVGLDEHVDGDILVVEVALGLGLHARVAVELQRDGLRHIVVVHFARHLEIGGGFQVVVLDVLGEVEDDALADVEDAVGGLRCPEELWASCVLDAAEHFRLGGEETVAVAAEEYGPQVVGLLHHHALAVELGGDVAVGGYHLTHSATLGHERRVGIVGAEVGPVVIASCGLLVLELDVVEVLLVPVEAADGDGEIEASLVVVWCIGVHHPLIAG